MDLKQVIVARADLKMGKGKIATQCCHASIEAFLETQHVDPDAVLQWIEQSQKKVVLRVDSKQEIAKLFQAMKKHFPCALIKDAGLTQLKPGTITALGIGPSEEKKLDKYTGKLKLL